MLSNAGSAQQVIQGTHAGGGTHFDSKMQLVLST